MIPPSINKPLAIICIACVFSFIAVFLSMCRGLAQVADEFDRTRVSTTGNNSPAIGTIRGNFDPSTITETQAVSVSGNLIVGSSSTASTIQMQNIVGTYNDATNMYTFTAEARVRKHDHVIIPIADAIEIRAALVAAKQRHDIILRFIARYLAEVKKPDESILNETRQILDGHQRTTMAALIRWDAVMAEQGGGR